MRKLSIGFVIDDNLDSTAGVQQFTLTLGNELARRGHHVKYITSETSKDHANAADIYSVSKLVYARMNGNRVGTPLPASTGMISDILNENQFDVVHVTTPYSPVLAGRVIRRTKAALVGTFHIAVDTPVAGIGAWLLARAQRFSLRRFHYWTAVSLAADDFAKTYYGITPEAITPNPIKLADFSKPTVPKKYQSNKTVVAFLGRLVERKGAQHLLSSLVHMDQEMLKGLDVRIGGGGPLRQKLEDFVAENRLSDVVTFYGFVPEEDKAAFLAAADIAVFPSTGGECFGISLLEGMAVGSTVVIGGQNKGYETVLGEGPGLLVDAQNHKAFASRLQEVLSSKQQTKDIIAWQDSEVQQYDVSKIADQMEGVYHEAMKRVRN